MKYIVVIAALATAHLCANAQTAPLSLDGAVRASLAHPAVRAARHEAQAAAVDVEAAKREKLPTLSVQTDGNGQQNTGSVSLYQPLWTAGRIDAQIRRSEALQGVAESRTSEGRDNIALRTIAAWQSLAGADIRTGLLRRQLERIQRFEAMMQRRISARISAVSDLDLVSSRVTQARIDLEAALSARTVADMQLQLLTGRGVETGLPVAESALDGQIEAYAQRLPANAADAIDRAIQQHPSARRIELEGAAASAELEARRAAQYPTFFVRATHNVGSSIGAANGVFFGFQYSPGAGLSSSVSARAAAERVLGQADTLDAARKDLAEAMNTEWQTYLNAKSRADSLGDAVSSTSSVTESYERQFVAGKRSWLDLLNSTRELSANEIALADAKVLCSASVYRLLARLGMHDWQQGTSQ